MESMMEQRTDAPSGPPASPAEAVFIVGVSRSGTTLMRRVLNASEQVAICSENHFMGHLIPSEGMRHRFRQCGSLHDDHNVYRLVEYLYGGGLAQASRHRGLSSHWRWLLRNVPQQQLLARLLTSDRSERALFETVMRLYAERKGKAIIGEKTPAHVRYVPELLAWFPAGRVIHMLRDPRAIFVSEWRRRQSETEATPYRQLRRVPWLLKLFLLLQVTLVWAESLQRARRHVARYPRNYFLLRFEDLVTEPEAQITRLCDFLGIPFQPAMLQQMVVSQGFQLGKSGFDAGAASRWKRHIDPWTDRWFRFWFGRLLRQLGYEGPAHAPSHPVASAMSPYATKVVEDGQ